MSKPKQIVPPTDPAFREAMGRAMDTLIVQAVSDPLPLGLPVKRPRPFLCMTCGYRTLVRDEFVDHHQKAHP